MAMPGRVAALVWKDLLIEVRTKASFHSMLAFSALVLFVFSFAIGPDTPLLRRIAAGLMWVAIVFTGLLSLSRTYQSEEAAGGLEGLRTAPGDPRYIYLGKLSGNLLLLLALEVVLFPAAAVLFQIEMLPHAVPLAGIALLGTFGISTAGTFYAALTLHLRAREIMLPLLLIPALVPPLLGAVNATQLVLDGNPFGDAALWVRLLIAYDVVFFVVCTWLFPLAVEN
ncbi:MAG: heme exporter protein CcmB [Gemmatimonadota bacterium]